MLGDIIVPIPGAWSAPELCSCSAGAETHDGNTGG